MVHTTEVRSVPGPPTGPGRGPRRGRRGWRTGASALVMVLAGCAGTRFAPGTPGVPPACDPAPWVGDEIPRLRAPFDATDDPAVEAAGLSALPTLLNLDEVQRAIVAEFVTLMTGRDEIPSGTVRHWLRVDVDGGVDAVELDEGSGDASLDEAAGRVVRTLELTPAVRGDCRVPVWVRYPIRFQARTPQKPLS